MITMKKKQEIILRYYRQGESARKISRDLGLHRRTVKRYIAEYKSEQAATEQGLLSSKIASKPKYDSSTRTKRKLTVEIREKIDAYLAQNRLKRQSGKHKQMLKKIDILEALHAGGYEISYTTVCNYIRSQEGKSETFIRQKYEAGQQCEFDWGVVKLDIGGQTKVYQLAVFYLNWSNYRWACLYERQDTQSFQQSHVSCFEHLGGVAHQMVYDNMRVAVRKFVGLHDKEPTEALLEMSMYYQFDFRFCNVRKGNEKGGVERSVEYIRRKAFALKDNFTDLAAANAHLQKKLLALNQQVSPQKGKSAKALLLDERSSLGHCPAIGLECADLRSYRVDKYATVCIDTNRYSVPEAFTGKMVEVKIYADHLQFYYEGTAIWACTRHRSLHGWYLSLDHYLETLRRKPGALNKSQALRSAEDIIQRIHDKYFREKPKEFLDLLHYQRNGSCSKASVETMKDSEKASCRAPFSWQQIQTAIDQIHVLGCREISLDKIKLCLENKPVDLYSWVQKTSTQNQGDEKTKKTNLQSQQTNQIEDSARQQLQQLTHLFHSN